MIANIKAWCVWFYGAHIQKTLGYLIGSLVGLDIVGLADPIKTFIGNRGFNVVLLASALVIAIRAHAKPAVAPLDIPPFHPPAS